jgi:FkbM family methyltransferase
MDYLESIKNDTDIYFLEIGAFDGRSFDTLYKYTHSNTWAGLFVEPIKEYYDLLKLNFENIENKQFENSAITEQNKDYEIKRLVGGQNWKKGSSTLLDNDNSNKYEYETETINGITFNTLVEKYNITKIDILQIDTEGYDLKILEQIIPLFLPKFIRVEQRHLKPKDKTKMKKLLVSCGYTYERVGLDYVCLLK